ncbi:TonB-dependent receptor [uncultured Alistipes sp.]|uniref:TonB-dependent receptor n=1 Tax=uncultured Alistipes sp. TaxID=538949 RepID=UPI0025F1B493|nr:TonB-dependent receptor [uncultured Alistipes sp.]
MKIKSLLVLVLSLMTLTAFAQDGGIKGKVVSRAGRIALDGVKVTMTPGDITTVSDAQGNFQFENIPTGEYSLQFETAEFEALDVAVRVGTQVRDINVVMLVPDAPRAMIDDAVFSEFDTETLNDAQSLPSSLSASKDLFNNIASYKFSEMRFNVRGYDSQYQDVYMNGIQLNDALTGYTPWSLWSGLNDATRNQEVTSGILTSDVGLGGIGGTTNINTRPSQMRKGLRASLVNGNSMYRFRAMVTYSSGYQDNGWSYAFSVSTRQGGNSYVNGVYYNAFGYFAAVEKQFNSQHRLALTILGAPTERGAQQAATQEAYDLVGNNYYNPNWGWQDGKKRNARVRNNHEPIAMLNYTFDISERSKLDVATSFRFGKNGYSALTWQNGADPRPDYYRKLPSYYTTRKEPDFFGAAIREVQWRANYMNVRHFDWDNMYQLNYIQADPRDEEIYGSGRRSNYMVEERHTDQLDWNVAANFSHIFRNNSKLTGGLTFRRNRTEYYSEIKDLLGGDYWADVDKFAERDFGANELASQNNLDYYFRYGHAHKATKGDKYSYDYYAHVIRTKAWAMYNFNLAGLGVTVGGEVGYSNHWREGLWRKGLFPNNSKGDSKKLDYLTYKVKGNFLYQITGAHTLEANIVYMQEAPEFQASFVSPRTRNTTTPGLSAERVFGVDASYNMRIGDFKARVSGYYTYFSDQSKTISYYDDVAATFTNFSMSGIDKRHFGLEAAVSIPLYQSLALNGAVSWGQYTYDSNPYYIQTQDNSGDIKSQGHVYWKNFRVESSPQTAVNAGLSYRSNNNLFLSVDFNYYNNTYLSMSPIYRTDAVITSGMTAEDLAKLRRQEKFDSAYTLNASIGKNWYIQRKYTLGFSLEVKNILNNQDIKTGGYEQTRLTKNTETTVETYEAFDSKYFYLFGTTYYLNIYFRF